MAMEGPTLLLSLCLLEAKPLLTVIEVKTADVAG
jgi:hypothetical protein